jgi:hypothetical protein
MQYPWIDSKNKARKNWTTNQTFDSMASNDIGLAWREIFASRCGESDCNEQRT